MYTRVAYASTASSFLSPLELRSLLEQSRNRNTRCGITGMLLYREGVFMQVIEGPEQAVRSLYRRIHNDRRHHEIIRLLEEHSSERLFPNWSMGFRNVDHGQGDDPRTLPGYCEILNLRLQGDEFGSRPHRCYRLLTTFQKNLLPC